MMVLPAFEIALAVAVLLMVLEIFFSAFVFLSFAVAMFLVSAVQFFAGNFSPGRDTLVFVVVAGVTFLAVRRFFRAHGDTSKAKDDVNQY